MRSASLPSDFSAKSSIAFNASSTLSLLKSIWNKAPTASTTATLAMGDALAICLLEKRGFTEEDFLVFHPGGALGKGILYKVEELMLTGEKLPIISFKL